MSRMKEIRESRGLGQKEVAAALGMPVRTYGSYERGERTLSLDIAAQIADVFDVPLDELLGREFDGMTSLNSRTEAELIEIFRSMEKRVQDLMLEHARMYAELSEAKKRQDENGS